jgi:O-antigen ligase
MTNPLSTAESPKSARRFRFGSGENTVWTLAFVGLVLYTVTVVTVRVQVGDLGIALGCIGLLTQRDKFRFPVPAALCAVFLAWAYLCAAFSDYPRLSLETAYEILTVFVMFVVAINALRSEQQIKTFVLIYLAAFMFSPGRGTIQGYLAGNTLFGRAIWNYNYENPNDLATLTILALGLAMAIANGVSNRQWIKNSAWFCVGLFVIIILLTQSRGAVLGVVIGFGAGLFRLIKGRRSVLILALITAAIAAMFVPDTAWERFAGMKNLTSTKTIADADPEGSAEKRWEIKQAAVKIFAANPVVGVGPGTYPLAMGTRFPAVGAYDTHDTYLNIAAEMGAPGLLIWCSMVGGMIMYARRSRLRRKGPLATVDQIWIERAIVAFLICGFFGSYGRVSYIYLNMAIVWALAAIPLDTDAKRNAGNVGLPSNSSMRR